MAIVTIKFDDGTEAEVDVRMAGMVRAERHFKGEIPPLEGTLWACWAKLKPGVPFDDWLETVESMERPEDVEGASGPLDQEQPPAE